jgi:hypothetical protein
LATVPPSDSRKRIGSGAIPSHGRGSIFNRQQARSDKTRLPRFLDAVFVCASACRCQNRINPIPENPAKSLSNARYARQEKHRWGLASTCCAGRPGAAEYFTGCAVAWRARTQNLGGEARNRAVADIVAAGNLAHRLAVTVAAPDCLALLMLGQFRFSAELVRRYRARMPRS